MAALPCDICQEETVVIPSGLILVDAEGAVAYRRYRVCTNPRCERYRVRRESIEQFLPMPATPELVDTLQLRAYLPPDASSCPSLFEDF
ncbi:hypothetical protein CBQ26_09190 [Deinococcus indicus]|uniref:Uncharacterized protein n=1 Tax=Deinococcus indicus TaxID=223556 RepID=A0A2D0A7Y9_9DEIO|nr:hypothetical protein CBQ26_09190 [Deinococcus indicus]